MPTLSSEAYHVEIGKHAVCLPAWWRASLATLACHRRAWPAPLSTQYNARGVARIDDIDKRPAYAACKSSAAAEILVINISSICTNVARR